METILRDLEQLAGIRHGCIFRHGRVLATTFPASMEEALPMMARLLEQVFRGARSIGRKHDEIYLRMGDSVVVGYCTEQDYVIALLASENINFSLVHVSVLSAARELEAAKPVDMTGSPAHEVVPAPESAEPAASEAMEDTPEPAPARPRTIYRGVARY